MGVPSPHLNNKHVNSELRIRSRVYVRRCRTDRRLKLWSSGSAVRKPHPGYDDSLKNVDESLRSLNLSPHFYDTDFIGTEED